MVLLKDLFEKASKEHKIVKKERSSPKFRTNTGFYRVRRVKCRSCVRGFSYQYRYINDETEKVNTIMCVDLKGLRDKVLDKGLFWGVEDYYLARKIVSEDNLVLSDLK